MKTFYLFVLVAWCFTSVSNASATQGFPEKIRVRIAAYNVLFGIWAKPERVGDLFKPYNLDVIGFSEVPDGDWTERVGRVLGMKYTYVGKSSSANHKDKYKSILSRTPMRSMHEVAIEAKGWSPASLVGAEIVVRGIPILVYSTHIPGRPAFTDAADGSAAEFIAESVIPHAWSISKATGRNLVILGDLNNLPGDEPLRRIEGKGMRSIWDELNIHTPRLSTHLHIETGKESGVIDHIYYNKDSKARTIMGGIIYSAFNPPWEEKEMSNYKLEWEQYGKPLSDHRPVWAVLEFPVTSSGIH